MARLFISYASPDSEVALRLAEHLKMLSHSVWLDRWEIGIGDSIPSKIAVGLAQSDFLIVLLSKHTALSAWVGEEVQIKYWEEITQRRTIILPALLEDCLIPTLLRPKRMADFRLGYEIGLAQLAITLHAQNPIPIQTLPDLPFPLDVQQLLPLSSSGAGKYTEGAMSHAPKLSEINVELSLPYIGRITGVWKPVEEEQKAAWELYVELVTRVSVAGLPPRQGLMRESLTSLHAIFMLTRDILRRYGPVIARPSHGSSMSFGILAVSMLNYALRPVLATWHPLLLDYEHGRSSDISSYQHEQAWERCDELRKLLHDTQIVLIEYSKLLAQVAQIPDLVRI